MRSVNQCHHGFTIRCETDSRGYQVPVEAIDCKICKPGDDLFPIAFKLPDDQQNLDA